MHVKGGIVGWLIEDLFQVVASLKLSLLSNMSPNLMAAEKSVNTHGLKSQPYVGSELQCGRRRSSGIKWEEGASVFCYALA